MALSGVRVRCALFRCPVGLGAAGSSGLADAIGDAAARHGEQPDIFVRGSGDLGRGVEDVGERFVHVRLTCGVSARRRHGEESASAKETAVARQPQERSPEHSTTSPYTTSLIVITFVDTEPVMVALKTAGPW